MRARYPDTEGFIERDGVKVGYEVFGDGEPAIVFPPVDGIVHSRCWKAQVPYLARYLEGGHDRPARERSVRPAANRRSLRRHRVRRRHDRGHGRHRRRPCGPGRALHEQLVLVPGRGPASRPGARYRCRFPVDAVPHPAAPAPRGLRLRRGARHRGRVGEGKPALLAAGLARVRRVLLRRVVHASRIRPSSGRTASAGLWRSARRRCCCITTGRCMSSGREETEALLRQVTCPVLVIHGPRGPLPAVRARRAGRRGHRRRAAGPGGGRARAPGQGARGRQPRHPGLRRPLPARSGRPEDLDQAAEPAETGTVRLLADRPRSRPPRPGHRRRTAHAAARPRGALAGPAPGHRTAESARRADPPRLGLPGQRVRAHREPVRRARPARLQGGADHGRDPGQQLHGLRRPGPGRALRPVGRRRGLGHRLLPAREPRAQAGAVRLDDRLRRLAAHAGRRCRGTGPDHRLQRGDDRAGRPLPEPAGPRGLRRQPR